ncbi:ImuA family protein [Ponticoccus alexandrii]|uniref:Protein ImuA n=1 Tax=Ponticoccus alexandrii TaxID=1943633 RepID=A0ABX7FE56_9RHOB|nr:hypothetical protein [Ponticoccus alexandrii]KID12561.1 hypothetical protein P279_27365 [Rhodobacteraceae bacterium PD-2]QRF68440.1 hypothetical protein GQA70_09015 [Ponticoccus alexandrii]
MLAPFHTQNALRPTRVHEVCGPRAFTFAGIVARAGALWVREAWLADHLSPQGATIYLDPAHMLVARPDSHTDALAVTEEALKNGALPFVVLEITRPLNLREGRRLQLAAKAGGTTGLCIIPEGMGSNAAETRWRATPVFDPMREDSTLMRWETIKNKSGTLGVWYVRWNSQTHCLHVVPPVGLQPGSAGLPD